MFFCIFKIFGDIFKVMIFNLGDIIFIGIFKGVGLVVFGDVMKVGIRINGKEFEEVKIEVQVEELIGVYQYGEM